MIGRRYNGKIPLLDEVNLNVKHCIPTRRVKMPTTYTWRRDKKHVCRAQRQRAEQTKKKIGELYSDNNNCMEL